MSVKRIYVVTQSGADQGETRLIRAATQASALRHATITTLACRVAEQNDLVALVGEGVKVEEAGES